MQAQRYALRVLQTKTALPTRKSEEPKLILALSLLACSSAFAGTLQDKTYTCPGGDGLVFSIDYTNSATSDSVKYTVDVKQSSNHKMDFIDATHQVVAGNYIKINCRYKPESSKMDEITRTYSVTTTGRKWKPGVSKVTVTGKTLFFENLE